MRGLAHALQITQHQIFGMRGYIGEGHDSIQISLHSQLEIDQVRVPLLIRHAPPLVHVDLQPVVARDSVPTDALVSPLSIV